MYRTCNSMNNLLSYSGLVDARMIASEKDLPVRTTSKAKALMKALNVSVSVLPLLPKQEDNSRRVVLRLH